MNLESLFTDDDAVSPVIGVILMVAITVILAAVIGAFVLNLGGGQESPPQTDWDWGSDSNSTAAEITLSHNGGDTVDSPEKIEMRGNVDAAENLETLFGGSISAGDSITVTNQTSNGNGDIDLSSPSGTTELVWSSSDGSQSQIIAEFDYDES